MSALSPSSQGVTLYAVQCPDYEGKPHTSRAAAERSVAAIERCGACQHTHRIVCVNEDGDLLCAGSEEQVATYWERFAGERELEGTCAICHQEVAVFSKWDRLNAEAH